MPKRNKRLPKKLILIFLFTYTSNSFSSTLTTVGDIGQLALPAAALVSTIYLHDRQGFFQFSKAYLSTMATVFLLKPIINSKRPDGGAWSFPSGHTASAFAGAGFIQQRYGWEYGVPAYLLGGVVGYSRVAAKRHWTTDVIAGGIIGIGANLLFTTKYPKLCVGTIADGRQVAVQAQVSW